MKKNRNAFRSKVHCCSCCCCFGCACGESYSFRQKVVYEAPIPLVTVANPVMGQISETLTLSAHVEARSMIPVIPMVRGTILEYPVSVGQTVEKGDLLAVIDEEPFKQQMLHLKFFLYQDILNPQ